MPPTAKAFSMAARAALSGPSRFAGQAIASTMTTLVLNRGVAKLANSQWCRDERHRTTVATTTAISAVATCPAVTAAAAVTTTMVAAKYSTAGFTTSRPIGAVASGTAATAITAGYASKLEREIDHPRLGIVADGEVIGDQVNMGEDETAAGFAGLAGRPVGAIGSIGGCGGFEPNAIA